jgi:hypothetical protein
MLLVIYFECHAAKAARRISQAKERHLDALDTVERIGRKGHWTLQTIESEVTRQDRVSTLAEFKRRAAKDCAIFSRKGRTTAPAAYGAVGPATVLRRSRLGRPRVFSLR